MVRIPLTGPEIRVEGYWFKDASVVPWADTGIPDYWSRSLPDSGKTRCINGNACLAHLTPAPLPALAAEEWLMVAMEQRLLPEYPGKAVENGNREINSGLPAPVKRDPTKQQATWVTRDRIDRILA